MADYPQVIDTSTSRANEGPGFVGIRFCQVLFYTTPYADKRKKPSLPDESHTTQYYLGT